MDDGLDIPTFLRRESLTLEERAARQQQRESESQHIEAALSPEQRLAYKRKHRRRLRAEVHELSVELDGLRVALSTGRASKADVEKAESKWKHAYTELAMLAEEVEEDCP